ncbi:hypothetical protein NDI56_21065 [Haloarcula sp. S1CR25-12]|uniref:Uncharacterized protein n=1 Tax=Haloarcula saliterrae TaxID=2950534 RepID=A0ABU2FI04_9EURY|nr:hypothetical protein [Haloarcula sp. S1CR25-12]MDS0261900.1 hypothetical protein [Haloarcula sp. S1CR25-12]
MSKQERYKFGRIDLPESELPTPDKLKDEIDTLDDNFEMVRRREDDPVTGGELEYREKARTTYVGDSHGDLSFCHFYYVADTENSIVVRNEDGEEEERNQPELVRPRVFYFENGMFAFESRQDLVEPWIPNFIGKLTDVDALDNSRILPFSQDMMRDFYDSREKITVFKFSSPDGEDFEGDTELAGALNDLTDTVESQQFSGGNSGKNLKGNAIVDEAAETMHIDKLHGRREDELTTNILASGVYVAAWSERDWSEPIETGTRAEAIFNRLSPQLRKLT